MRIAVLSDVHGNLRALEAVVGDLRRQAPDLVVHAGDLALNGPRPAEVVDRIRELGWPGARGNADELLWAGLGPVPPAEREFADALRQATLGLLGPDRMRWLRRLPRLWRHEELAVLHASPTTLEEAPPVDGDWRPSYLLIDDGEVSVRRVAYDLEAQIAELRASTYPSRGWLIRVHRRAESVRPLELDPPAARGPG